MIKGFLPLSFIEWRGRLSSVVFFGGCNFRCPFCHNRELVVGWEGLPDLSLRDILSYVKGQKKWVEHIVVTGGEPTIQRDLVGVLRAFKGEGLSIKLETNGSRPEVLRAIIEEGLVDHVAMDVKGPLRDYNRYCGTDVDRGKIEESISILEEKKVEFEFRMTVVPFLHKESDVYEVATFLKGRGPLILQNFRPKNTLDPAYLFIEPLSEERFAEMNRKIDAICKRGSFDKALQPPSP